MDAYNLTTYDFSSFVNKINLVGGVFLAFFTWLFGKYWVLFIGYLVLNFADIISGCMKSYLSGKSSSVKGLRGVVKKLGYWMIIGLAFGLSVIFVEMGKALNIDLSITINIGYITLGTLILNEARSIIENLVECGYHPPKILTKGLEVAGKVVEKVSDIDTETEEEKKEEDQNG